MLKIFANRGKGSVTVFVTLIMIPTIFFTAFLGDLARVKLYSNIALMSADNYAESILTEYDDLLRELYGFFSVSQNSDAIKALDTLASYSKTSFNPNANTINYRWLKSIRGETSYEGFAPYSGADVSLSKDFIENSSLTNDEVFATQLGDFMRFRIAQQLLMSGDVGPDGELGDQLLKLQNETQSHEDDAKAIEAEEDLADVLDDYLKLIGKYYCHWYLLEQYKEYVEWGNVFYLETLCDYDLYLNSEEYDELYEYSDPANKEVIEKAIEKRKAGGKLTEEEQHYCDISEHSDNNKDFATYFYRNVLTNNQYINTYLDHKAYYPSLVMGTQQFCVNKKLWEDVGYNTFSNNYINAINYDKHVTALKNLSAEIRYKSDDIITAKNKLLEIVGEKDAPKVSQSIYDTVVEDTLPPIDKLVNEENLNRFDKIAKFYDSNIEQNNLLVGALKTNGEAFDVLNEAIYRMEVEPKSNVYYHLTNEGKAIECYENAMKDIYDGKYKGEFQYTEDVPEYKQLYDDLTEAFDSSKSTKKEEAEKPKEEAKKQQDQADSILKNDEKADVVVRDIPESYNFGGDGGETKSTMREMMDMVGNLFSSKDISEKGNEMLLKVYTVEYDYGMFSSRITPVTKKNEKEGKEKSDSKLEKVVDNATGTSTVSLTGYEKSKSINYLYGGELEYVLNGSNSSQANLNYTRNMICGFRMVMNFGSSFAISEVNTAIKTIGDACLLVPFVGPGLKIVVELALRLAFAALETKAEWENLIKGKQVVLFKNKLGQLECAKDALDFLKSDDYKIDFSKAVKGGDDAFSLSYEQYLMIMLLFLRSDKTINARTRHLIELNVNSVLNGVEEGGSLPEEYSELGFKMTDTRTAVKTTCSVHMDFALIPDGFAKAFLGAKSNEGGVSYEEFEEFENTTYQFEVIRGY